MTNDNNKLVEILPADWKNLRNKFLPNWPKDIVGFSIVDNYIRWWEKDNNIKNLHFYSLNGDWSDGTFLVIDRYQLFIYSLNEDNDRLRIALSLLDWRNGFKVSSFILRHRQSVLQVVEPKQLKKEYDSKCFMYYYPKMDANKLQLKIPDGMTLKPLSVEHAKIADDVWPNKHEGSLFLLKRLLKWNPNIGLFDKDDKLIAWCFRLQAGPLGALQVLDSHYRMGLGTLVVIAMIKLLADLDMDTFALVGYQNLASQKLFERIGFKQIDEVYWLRTYPITWKNLDEEISSPS